MLKALKISGNDNEIIFVSDAHIGHDKDFIWGKRGFNSVIEHDQAFVKNWNSVSSDNTIAFHLGDFCFGDPSGEKFKNLVRSLKFKRLYCLLGNHNSSQSAVYKDTLFQFGLSKEQIEMGMEVYPLSYYVDGNLYKEVVFLPEFVEAIVNGQRISLCHYPIISHHKAGHASWMICGHSHGSCEFTNKNTCVGLRLDVGIESFGRPVTFQELKTFFKNKEVVSFDHHSSKTT